MALPNWALISVADYRERYSAAGTGQAANIEAAIMAGTLAIERRIHRQLRTRGPFTEYHTLGWRDRLTELFVSEWPIISAEIHEDSSGTPRTYGPSSLLVEGTDYELVAPDRIRRLSGGASGGYWASGSRAIRNVLTAGYRGLDELPDQADDLPADLQQVAFFIAASIFAENDRKRWGVSAATDASGNYQRFVGYFTPAMDEMLAGYKRREFHRTWERAA